MAEWFKAHAWNACVRESVPRVRIPLLPPVGKIFREILSFDALVATGVKDVPFSRREKVPKGRMRALPRVGPADIAQAAFGVVVHGSGFRHFNFPNQ